MSARIRAARERRGWSQAELADRAGVSRQLVGALEAGRHVPNVTAAMAIATALGSTVEELFGPTSDRPTPVTGDPLSPGTAVSLGRVGTELVAIPAAHRTASSEAWALTDGVVDEDGAVSLVDTGPFEGLVIAGCDPAVALIAGLVERRTRHRIVAFHASTARSIKTLASGHAHAAVVHGPAGALPAPPLPVRRWHLARWQVGLASGRGKGVPTVDEIAERRLRVVQRDEGAGTQQAFTRALARIGAKPAPGPIAEGHIDVARRVAAGAPVGVTMEAASRSFDLRFCPLETHEVELWVDQRWADLPEVTAVVETLNSPALRSRLGFIGGYELTDTGARVA
jgi:DNA-binding XRE family transcriptional regulator